MKGLMAEAPLTLDLVLRRCLTLGRTRHVTLSTPGSTERFTWAELGERAKRLSRVIERLGVARGGRVGTFAWNTHRHVELLLATPVSGRVVHTVNVRLSGDDIAYLVEHAGDEVLFVDASLTAQLAPLKKRLPVREYVVLDDGGEVDPAFADCPGYEELLAAESPDFEPSSLDERDAAWICYTSGTTGRPKGVVATHRSVLLHSMAALMGDSHGVTSRDTVLLATSMFHVAGWGLPYTCALAPANLAVTGRHLTPEHLCSVVEAERVTIATGVTTIWIQMEKAFAEGTHDVSSLRRLLCGGTPIHLDLVARLTQRGMEFLEAWGMTEMSPIGTSHIYRPGELGDPDEASGLADAGFATPLVEVRIVDDAGNELPWDGRSVGEIEARSPWTIGAYLDPDDDANEARFHEGWLRSGDLGRIRPDGTLEVVDRVKDLIKSGGEWISSLDLEQALVQHPAVAEVVVVAMPHEHWGERPAAVIVPTPGSRPSAEELAAFLLEQGIAKWWLPDVVELVDEIPKTGVGKYDKRTLRARFEERAAAASGTASS